VTTCWCRFQLRCVLSQPLTVYPGAEVAGELRLVAHKRQSYDVHLRLSIPSLAPGVPDQTVSALLPTCLQGISSPSMLDAMCPTSTCPLRGIPLPSVEAFSLHAGR
jgi:hypothetical protein